MNNSQIIPIELIENKIFLNRKQKVLVDCDLAQMYGVETKLLNKTVSRNINRFPIDFMFRLSQNKFQNLKFHFGTSSWGGTRKLPRVFIEQGVAMLSGVLRSPQAIHVNTQIIRAFVKMRELLSSHKELSKKLEELELKITKNDKSIMAIFEAINQLIKPLPKSKRKIGFIIEDKIGEK